MVENQTWVNYRGDSRGARPSASFPCEEVFIPMDLGEVTWPANTASGKERISLSSRGEKAQAGY